MLANFGRCAHRICMHFAPRLGISEAQAIGAGAAFGSGMGHGETCGCVTGALLVLGLRYSQGSMEDAEKMSTELQERVADFEERFLAKHKSLICKEILEADISQPEGMKTVMDKGLFACVCGPMVAETCTLLEEMLAQKA